MQHQNAKIVRKPRFISAESGENGCILIEPLIVSRDYPLQWVRPRLGLEELAALSSTVS